MKIVIGALLRPFQFLYRSHHHLRPSTLTTRRDHGCDDAGISDPSDRYINQPGKGPSTHTNEFMDGYYDGFYECSTTTNNSDSDYPDYFLDENLSHILQIL